MLSQTGSTALYGAGCKKIRMWEYRRILPFNIEYRLCRSSFRHPDDQKKGTKTFFHGE
ncbi:MAG: hypothetical protein HFE65_00190 [Clostridiales bacterium]|nr:hypothetical protein [Clostridiales bacterium]